MNTSTPKLADKPTLADGPPGELRIDPLNTATPNLADKPTLANGPPGELRTDALNTTTPNLADEPTLADGPPSELRIDALNTPLHQTWQMNLLWPMDPPSELRIDALNTAIPNLADKPTVANGPPQYWHLVVKNGNFTFLLTSRGQEWQLADLPADLPPGTDI